MDKGLLLMEEIEAWQRSEVTRLLFKGLEEILQAIREGYMACNDDQFKVQKGREMQTIAIMDLIERKPGDWLDPEAARLSQNKTGDAL